MSVRMARHQPSLSQRRPAGGGKYKTLDGTVPSQPRGGWHNRVPTAKQLDSNVERIRRELGLTEQ